MNKYPYQQAAEEYHCDHEGTEIRYRIIANGLKQFRQQCLYCGQATTPAIAYNKINDIDNVPEWDHELQREYSSQVRNRIDELWAEQENQRYLDRSERKREWFAWYNEYLCTSQWRDKRQRVLERDNYTCKACELRSATQVHHLTYDHVGNEPLFDLVSICEVCHNALHKREDV